MGKKRRKKNHQAHTAVEAPSTEVPAPSVISLRFKLIAIIIILTMGILAYANSFQNEFIWDDLVIIQPSEYIREFNVAKIFTTDVHHFSYQPSNFYRPLQMLSFAINYRIGGLNPFGYHLFNALVHTLNACLLFLIFVQLNLNNKFVDNHPWRWIALFSALIWVVHPIHTQNTTYVSGRADVLVTCFILFSFYSYSRRKFILTPIFFTAALLSKELAIITPLFFILFDVVIDKKFTKAANKWREGLICYGPMAAVAIIYTALRMTIFNFPTAFTTEEIPSFFPRMLTSARAIVNLFGILAVPINLSMLRNIPWEYSLASIKVIISILGVTFLIASAFWLKAKKPLVTFCIFWFFIAYIPVLNVIPMNANMSEHWMYLPSSFFILMCVYLLWQYIFRQKTMALAILLVGLTFCYSYLLFERNKDYKNQIVFFEDLLKYRPQNARAHYNLGTSYGNQKNYVKAKSHFLKALKNDPSHAPAYANLGLIYSREGDLNKAIDFYEKANSIQDNLVENHANLGIAYAQKGRNQDALNSFKRALALNPKHPAALNGIGIEYAKTKKFDEAERYFKKVLDFYPNHSDAQSNLKRLNALKKNTQLIGR